jgi:hypothetical protein
MALPYGATDSSVNSSRGVIKDSSHRNILRISDVWFLNAVHSVRHHVGHFFPLLLTMFLLLQTLIWWPNRSLIRRGGKDKTLPKPETTGESLLSFSAKLKWSCCYKAPCQNTESSGLCTAKGSTSAVPSPS